MDVSQFYTAHIPQDRKDTTVNANGAARTGALPGQNFLDFILAQLAENPEVPVSSSAVSVPKDETAALKEEIRSWMLDSNSELAQALALNQEALDAALGAVNDGIITSANIEAGSPQLMQALMVETDAQANGQIALNVPSSAALEKLQAILDKLQALAKGGKAGELTLANLTPAQTADIKAQIESLLNENAQNALSDEQERKALDGIYLGLIKIISPTEQASASASVQAALNKVQNDQANKVNDLTSAPQKTSDTSSATPNAWAQQGADEGTSQNIGKDGNKFGAMLNDFSGKKAAPQLEASATAPGVKAGFSALQGWPFTLEGSLFVPTNWSQVPYETIGGQNPALTVTSLGTLTNLVTQAHAASQPHPAIQMVAATISKAAANGEPRAITLQLDPPELGRVEVRMSFGKDKTVKAVLLAEKPETLAMLQRDAHSLERALVSSGLDVSGGGIDFSLAQEGYDFNGQNGGDDGSNRYGSNDGSPEEIIESTMTWRVDPETGHMRYSIFA